MKRCFVFLFSSFLVLTLTFAHAQAPELDKAKELMGSNWIFLLKIGNKPEPRILKIKGITQVDEKTFTVAATYGQINGQGPIRDGLLSLVNGEYRIVFTNQSNNRVEAILTKQKTFKGVIIPPQGSSQDILMFRASDEDSLSAKAIVEAIEVKAAAAEAEDVSSSSVVIPERISGRWKNNKTGYGQSFSMERITVSGTSFTGNFTQWFDSSCVVRSTPVKGEIKKGVVTFDFTPPCYSTATVKLDFTTSTGTYRFGSGEVAGSYDFK